MTVSSVQSRSLQSIALARDFALRFLHLMVQPDIGLASVPVLDQVQVSTWHASTSTIVLSVVVCTLTDPFAFQLPRSCQTFKCRHGNKEQTIYIVGTAHVSSESCDDVRAVIRAVKPEVYLLAQSQKMLLMWSVVEDKVALCAEGCHGRALR